MEIMEWFENDRFWLDNYPKLFRPARWEGATADVDDIIALSGVSAPADILDLCCGPGRHSIAFAKLGFSVTGVDLTRSYLEEAENRTLDEGVEIEYVQMDMREFESPGSFDLAVNLYTSFGYFKDVEDDRLVLHHLYQSLRTGGRLVMELMSKEVLARIFRERDWYEEDGMLLLEERKVSDDWSWVESRWIMFSDRGRTEHTVEHRLYSGKELTASLTEAGFKNIRTYGSLKGILYNQNAERLVAVAEK
jgi:SAM-dependent methyltransferase